MNLDANNENRRTLLNMLNVEETHVEKILGANILITGKESNKVISEDLLNILSRTFDRIDFEKGNGIIYSCEIILGEAAAVTAGAFVYCGQKKEGFLVASCIEAAQPFAKNTHEFLLFMMSCYTSALVLKTIIGKGISVTAEEEIIIEINKFIKDTQIFNNQIDVEEAYLAGAGAIGNSFIYALSKFKVKGRLIITDPDFVSGGNLNRCLFFTGRDINKKKVDALVEHSQPLFPSLELVPFSDELSKVPSKNKNELWLQKLIVGVDSRRARRTLQNEIPKEIFDASTTGIAEVVLHHHKRPLHGKACLGCIYYKEAQEAAHEQHVAEVLGVTLDQVKQQFIDESAACSISNKYLLAPGDILGIPYDTLFKQLCGEGKLVTAADKQVLAPLAFVSGLAGALLALKVMECHVGMNTYNYWRVSPWMQPNFRLQKNIRTNINCKFCNDPVFLQVAKQLWA